MKQSIKVPHPTRSIALEETTPATYNKRAEMRTFEEATAIITSISWSKQNPIPQPQKKGRKELHHKRITAIIDIQYFPPLFQKFFRPFSLPILIFFSYRGTA